MKRRTSLAILSTVLLGLATASGTALAQQKDKASLMLNWYVTGPNLAFYLGKEKGFFDQENIDLEILEGRGSGPTVQAVAANNVTFGYADVSIMIKIAAKGAPVKAVGVAVQTSPISLIGLAEKNIRKPEDLKGKTIAITAGDAPSQMWPLFMKKTGLKESDVKFVNGDSKTKVNAVINGQADVLIGFSTDQTFEIQHARQKPVHALMFADHGVNNVGLGIVAHQDLLKSNPDLVKRFMRAATKSFEAAKADPNAAVEAALKASPKSNRDGLLAGFAATVPLLHTAETANQRPFRVSPKSMEETVAMLTEHGGVDKAAGSADKFYTNEFLP